MKVRATARATERDRRREKWSGRQRQRRTQIESGSIHNSVQENTVVLRLSENIGESQGLGT